MKFTPKALELMRIFSSGVSCPSWDENTVEKTMFYPHCEGIARKTNKEEIDEEVVKEYFLKVHNQVTGRVGIVAGESIESIKNCMVCPKKIETGWVCVHGNKEVMAISQEEAEILEKENKKILESLQ
ncbi:MAG: hypothetical protein ACOZAL_01450 [Patescibacteria group bacterium]